MAFYRGCMYVRFHPLSGAENAALAPHRGFNLHSKVRTRTREEAERVDKYMIRAILSLKKLSFDETEGNVSYQYGTPERPPPPQVVQQELLTAAEESGESISESIQGCFLPF